MCVPCAIIVIRNHNKNIILLNSEEEILSEKNEKHDALRRLVFSHANRGGSIDGRVGAHHHDNRPTIDAITDTHFPNTESKSDGKSSDNRVPRSDEGNVEM